MANTPAGWYPQEDGRQRYWDGETWTEHFAPGTQQGAATAGGTASAAAAPAAAATQSAARPWFRKKRFVVPAGLAGVIILASALGAGGAEAPVTPTALETSASTAAAASTSAAATPVASAAPVAVATKSPAPVATPAAKPKPAAPTLTPAQENAKGSAESYLDMSGFSKQGLVEQLEFEGYEAKDIEAAMATMKVDWNAEAAQSAEAYRAMTSFSRSGLIDQLKFEGYTSKQAAYGADSVGL